MTPLAQLLSRVSIAYSVTVLANDVYVAGACNAPEIEVSAHSLRLMRVAGHPRDIWDKPRCTEGRFYMQQDAYAIQMMPDVVLQASGVHSSMVLACPSTKTVSHGGITSPLCANHGIDSHCLAVGIPAPFQILHMFV